MTNKYSFTEYLKTSYSLIMTKLIFPQARLIRRPIYLRGKKSLFGGKMLTTGRFCRFDLEGKRETLIIGDNCEFGDMTHIVAHEKVAIGNNVLIASKCFISDTEHGLYKGKIQSNPKSVPRDRQLYTKQVIIGSNVWIGENVVILAGTNIGSGCIIGANSVVKGIFEDNCMLVGVPAKVIKRFDSESEEWLSENKDKTC